MDNQKLVDLSKLQWLCTMPPDIEGNVETSKHSPTIYLSRYIDRKMGSRDRFEMAISTYYTYCKVSQSTFRKCRSLVIFCTNFPPYHHPSYSMKLGTPLGSWFKVQRNTWLLAYKSATGIFWRKDEDRMLYQMTTKLEYCQ